MSYGGVLSRVVCGLTYVLENGSSRDVENTLEEGELGGRQTSQRLVKDCECLK